MKNTETYSVVGLMSGTSLDGVDLVHCRFQFEDGWQYEIIKAETFDYEADTIKQLKKATSLTSHEIERLDKKLGIFYSELILEFLAGDYADFIASHGHTVFHQPVKNLTLQIGNGQEMHSRTGIPVINNFRSIDVQKGGQGAPLVPVGDHFLFVTFDACVNLGGISNISYLDEGVRKAFDISPCNMLLNEVTNKLGLAFDNGGQLSREGKVISSLLEKWEQFEFFELMPPKSLGYEWVSKQYFEDLDNDAHDERDLLRTIVEHIANQVSKILRANSKVLITGGGAKNDFLIERMESKLTEGQNLILPEEELIDYKEALIFGFLGVLRYRNEINTFSSVTGASSDSCAGDMIGF